METKMMMTKTFFKLVTLYPAGVRIMPMVISRSDWYVQIWAYPLFVLSILLMPVTYVVSFLTWLGIDLWHLIRNVEYGEYFCEYYELMKELNCKLFLEFYRMILED